MILRLQEQVLSVISALNAGWMSGNIRCKTRMVIMAFKKVGDLEVISQISLLLRTTKSIFAFSSSKFVQKCQDMKKMLLIIFANLDSCQQRYHMRR